jgi:predicted Zn-dependent peptidase
MKLLSKFNVEFHQSTLKNGVSVFLFKRKGMPIYLRAVFFSGSRFDTKSGTAHFLEHMLFAGTEKFPSKNLIADHIQRVGGDFSASTEADVLKFNIEIPEVDDIDIGIDTLNQCLNKSLFDPTNIENERGAILSELSGKKASPKAYIWDVSRRITMQGTPICNNNLGTEDSINSIILDDIKNFKEKSLHTGNLSFVVSGDIDINLLTEKLNDLIFQNGDTFSITEKLPIIKKVPQAIEKYPGSNVNSVIACRTSIADYKEYCALQVLNNILAVGRGSRLATILRYQNGLVYSVSGSLFNGPDWGCMNIEFACIKDNFKKTIDLIYAEFDSLNKTGISKTDLENTKSKISKGMVRSTQTSKSWVDMNEIQCVFYSTNPKTVDDYVETIKSLTLSDVNNVIQKYLRKENFYTAICGDY